MTKVIVFAPMKYAKTGLLELPDKASMSSGQRILEHARQTYIAMDTRSFYPSYRSLSNY